MLKKIPVFLVVDVDNDDEACDAANEILRCQQRSFSPASCLLDYAVGAPVGIDINADDYEEGDAFTEERMYDLYWHKDGKPVKKVGDGFWRPMTHTEAVAARSKFSKPADIMIVEANITR